MNVAVRALGPGVYCLKFAGEIDIATMPKFRSASDRLLGGDVRGLVIDMAEVTFLDSSGLGFLLRVLRDMSLRQAPLVLAGLTPELRDLFRITGTERLFQFASDPAEAAVQIQAVVGG